MNEDERFVIPADGTPPPDKAHELAQNIVPGPGLVATPAHPVFRQMIGYDQTVYVTEEEVEAAQNPAPITVPLPAGDRPTRTATALGDEAPNLEVVPTSVDQQVEEATAEVAQATSPATTPPAKSRNGGAK